MTSLEKFQADIEKGWDYAINNLYIRIMRKDSTSNEDIIILAYICEYNTGYEYMVNNAFAINSGVVQYL